MSDTGETGGSADPGLNARGSIGMAQAIFGALVFGVFAVFVFTVRDILSPPIVFLLLIFVLAPLWGRPLYKIIAVAASVLLLLWALRETGTLLAPFILAFILAYMLDPVVDRLQRWRLPRSLAIAALVVPVAGAGVLAVFFGAPAIGEELSRLISALPGAWSSVAGWLDGFRDRIVALGIPGLNAESVPRLSEVEPAEVAEYLAAVREELATRIWEAVVGVGRGIATAFTVVSYVVLTPILTFYLLRDYDRILAAIRDLLPERQRPGLSEFAGEFHELLSRYLRGQVLVAGAVGLLTFVGYSLLGFPFALLLGVIAGVFNVVPYLGAYVSLVPAVAIALLSEGIGLSLIKVGVVFGSVQLLEGAVISPAIVGEAVELNPVWIILALSVFGYVFGLVGLLIGVPLAIFLKLAIGRGIDAYRSSSYFRAPAEG